MDTQEVPEGGKVLVKELGNNYGTATKESDGFTVYLHLKQGEDDETEFYTYFTTEGDAREYLESIFEGLARSYP